MNRAVLSIYILLVAITSLAFSLQSPTKSIIVSGKVKAEHTFRWSDLQKFPAQSIGDVVISNHKGETKGTAKGMKGVLLRDVLQQVILDTDNPKLYSEYYFVCKATDGYKAVYSWNELFNTATGNTVYIVTEKEQKNMTDDQDNILMISTQDLRTGRRYVKNLETIYVGRAQ
jgi:hypothetical protein